MTTLQVPPDVPSPFYGMLIELDRPRRCCVCGQAMPAGGRAFASDKYVAHIGCGRFAGSAKPPKGAK